MSVVSCRRRSTGPAPRWLPSESIDNLPDFIVTSEILREVYAFVESVRFATADIGQGCLNIPYRL